ncbi:helix-turn-helix domain-containing protein [Persicobacter diffluens]|uniref:Helix-turn-helix domain-containing protein n=1 Tax=Persicobacter diffluens TaxID=981 RepID=A0AAN4VXQ8_9BACT|nr:hypothetical protein PEDI_17260 [Persicobacter diffluens]
MKDENSNPSNALFSFNEEMFKSQIKKWVKEALQEMNGSPEAIASKLDQNGLLNTREACKYLNVSAGGLKKLIDEGFVVPATIGRKKLFRATQLLAALDAKREAEKQRLEDKNARITKAKDYINLYKNSIQGKKPQA